VVGNGSVAALGRFEKRYSDAVAIYTDPDCVAFSALGMLRGMGGVSGIKMLAYAARAARRGHRQGRTQGHPTQQGGVCIFDVGGALLFAHRDVTAGDHLDPKCVLDVLDDRACFA
jgi:hypothetical protein